MLHNTVQNTSDVDNQMRFLAWNMDSLAADMHNGVEKYCILIHLWDFSLFNCPPMTSTRETLQMLTTCYPERMGHCVAIGPPSVFKTFYNMVSPLIDSKTQGKMVFLTGDCRAGSKNDETMKFLVVREWEGPQWEGPTPTNYLPSPCLHITH